MTQKKNIFQIFAGFSVGPIIAAILGFGTVILISWFLEPAENSKVALFQLYLNFGTVFITLGYDQAFTREFYQEKTTKLLFHVVLIPSLFATINLASLLLFPNFFGTLLFGSADYNFLVFLSAITLTGIVVNRFALLIIRMEEKGLLYSFFSILSSLIILIFDFILLYFWRQSFESIIISTMIANVTVMVFALFVTRKNWKIFKIKFDKQLFKKLTYFALPLVPAMIITFLFQSIDRISLAWYSNDVELGLFQFSMTLSQAMVVIQNIFASAWIPIAYKWHQEDVNKKNFELIGLILMALLIIAFFGLMLGREVLGIISGPSYQAVITIFPFLTLSPIMYTLAEVTGLGIPFARKNKYTLFLSIIVLAVNFTGNYFLVPKFGALGATVSTGLSYIIFFWLRTLISRRLWYKFQYGRYVLFTVIVLLGALYNTVLSRELAFLLNSIVIILIMIVGIYFVLRNKSKLRQILKELKG